MRRWGWGVLAALLVPAASLQAQASLDYYVDLHDRADDRFKVVVVTDQLGPENAVFQFASTAPGTYQLMDIGRFVEDFRAFDGEGNELRTERISTNQWRIHDASRVREIRYTIAETWDTPVEEHRVYPMAGTSMEDDHVLLNPHAVFGFPSGLQDAPIRLHLSYPEDWKLGTALDPDPEGAFVAEDYDELVDSPVLMGRLTVARTEVSGVPVEIYTYSKSGGVTSKQLLGAMDPMLHAAGDFLGRLPVDRYTFLYLFEDPGRSQGAWEHSQSSEYTFVDLRYSERVGRLLTDIAAHEFFHVVTPLNIHSEIIENFNFITPVPSEHLWLYEGVTEWASDAMQLRSDLKSPEEYLRAVLTKMRNDARFDAGYSLSELALSSYTDEGQRQYANIYERGALVAGLLDIRLLELSDGKRGLQTLMRELVQRFGKGKPFPEAEFFDVITEMTYPEIGDFLARYVRRAEPLPIKEYYAKLGIRLVEDEKGDPTGFEIDPKPTERQQRLREAWLTNH
ncbi:MAG: peptidase [Gemmatimonadota bacterium]